MSNIKDLRTVGDDTIYVVDGIPSLGPCADPVSALGTPASVGSIAMFDGTNVSEVSKATFSQVGAFYDVVGVGKAIQLYDGTNAGQYFWFNVTDTSHPLTPQTDPGLVGTANEVDILLADTPAQIAVKFAAVVNALAGVFTAPVPPSTIVTITNVVGGVATDVTATGSAAAVYVAIQGAAAGTVGHLYLKTGVADYAWTEIATNTSTGNNPLVNDGLFRRVALYSIDASGATLSDNVTQNTQPIDVIVAAQPTRSVGIEYTIPNPGDAIAAADFVLTQGDQTIFGNKTFGTLLTPTTTVFNGEVDINGTLTYINTTVMNITDKFFTLNVGGGAGTGAGVGFKIEEAGVPTGYILTNATEDGYLIKAPAALGYGEMLFSALTGNQTYTWQNLSGVVALQSATAGVDKQIAFYNASLLLDSESGTALDAITWDYSTNMLGVRTNAPTRPLDVNGTSIFRGALRIEQPTSLVNYEIFQATIPTSSAAVTPIETIATATNTVMLIEARVLARRTDVAGNSATYIRTFRAKNVGGTVSILNVDSMYTSEDVVAWNVTATVSGTSVVINVIGDAISSITWNTTTIVQVL